MLMVSDQLSSLWAKIAILEARSNERDDLAARGGEPMPWNQHNGRRMSRDLDAIGRRLDRLIIGSGAGRQLVVVNSGEAMFPDGRFVATFAYGGHYRWTRVSLDGESKGDFYKRVMAEAREHGGVLTVAGGMQPEPREDCDSSWTVV
jgi:hypothetical protein